MTGDQLPTVRDVVRVEIKDALKRSRRTATIFLSGVGLFVIMLLGTELATEAQLLRMMHQIAFPEPALDRVAVSYESFLELRAQDLRSVTRSIAFYAEQQQKVEVYARVVHRFAGDQELRRIFVSIDGQRLTTEPLTDFEGGFHDMTDQLSFTSDFVRQANVHHLTFSLDDSQPDSLPDEVNIVCVILVYGNTK